MPDFAIDPAGLRTAIDRHPDLGAAIARTRQAEADIGLARAEKRPDWAFDVAYQRRADRYGDMVSAGVTMRSEEHTSELQSLMRHSYAVFCLKKKNQQIHIPR